MDHHIDPHLIARQPTVKIDKKAHDLQSLKKSSQEFEAMLVMEMLKAMRQASPPGGLFEKSTATELYREMLDAETAKAACKGKGLGIAEAIYRQMAPLVEKKK
jgi:flagellar protein FlgJ